MLRFRPGRAFRVSTINFEHVPRYRRLGVLELAPALGTEACFRGFRRGKHLRRKRRWQATRTPHRIQHVQLRLVRRMANTKNPKKNEPAFACASAFAKATADKSAGGKGSPC